MIRLQTLVTAGKEPLSYDEESGAFRFTVTSDDNRVCRGEGLLGGSDS